MLPWIILSALLIGVDAKIQWTFSNVDDFDRREVFLNAEIGTPGQKVQLRITQDSIRTYLGVPSTNRGGNFDPNASSTFQQTGIITNKDAKGISGTDNFVIGGATFKNLPLNVYTDGAYYYSEAFVSLAYSNDSDASFIQALLKTQEQRTAIISYDRVDYFGSLGIINGTLTLGGDAEECSSNWTRIPEAPARDSYMSWAFKADKLTVGKYQKRNPATIELSFNSRSFAVPDLDYDNIIRAMGGDDSENWIPCDADTKIRLTVAGIDFEVGPETYLEPTESGLCFFEAEQFIENEKFYRLPHNVLKDLCFMYDYEKKEIGFAPKLK